MKADYTSQVDRERSIGTPLEIDPDFSFSSVRRWQRTLIWMCLVATFTLGVYNSFRFEEFLPPRAVWISLAIVLFASESLAIAVLSLVDVGRKKSLYLCLSVVFIGSVITSINFNLFLLIVPFTAVIVMQLQRHESYWLCTVSYSWGALMYCAYYQWKEFPLWPILLCGVWYAVVVIIIDCIYRLRLSRDRLMSAWKRVRSLEESVLFEQTRESIADERLAIAGVLHDTIVQDSRVAAESMRELYRLHSGSFSSESSERSLGDGDFQEMMWDVLQNVDNSYESVRSITLRLEAGEVNRPSSSIEEAMEAMHEDLERRARLAGIDLEWNSSSLGSLKSLPVERALLLVRGLNVFVGNAIRHSRSASVRISVSERGKFIELRVEDDGIGFKQIADWNEGASVSDPGEVHPSSFGLGLRLYSYSLQRSGGSIRVVSGYAGGGTAAFALLRLMPEELEPGRRSD